MTPTALKNKEIESREKVAREDRRSRENVASEDRKSREHIAKKDRTQKYLSGAFDTIGKAAQLAASIGLTNDPIWYKKLPELLKVICNLPTYYPNGMQIPGSKLTGDCLPSVVTLPYADVLGSNTEGSDGVSTNNATSTLNISAQRLLAELRKYNSRIGDYESGDLVQVLIGMLGVLVFLQIVHRAVKCYYKFNAFHPDLARELIIGQGFDYDDFNSNIKQLTAWLEARIKEANTFLVVPRDWSYASRKLFLSGNIWKEGQGDNACYVQCTPVSIPKYWEDNAEVTWEPLYDEDHSKGLTFDYIQKFYESLMNGIMNTSVLTTMIADIKGAQGIEFITLTEYDANADLPIGSVEEVLDQLMNTKLAPNVRGTDAAFVFDGVQAYAELDSEAPASHIAQSSANRDRNSEGYYPQLILKQDSAGFLVPEYWHKEGSFNTKLFTMLNRVYTASMSAGDKILLEGTVKSIKDRLNTFMLNFYDNNITEDKVLVSTRNAIGYDAKVNYVGNYGHINVQVTTSCTEVFLGMFITTQYDFGNEELFGSVIYGMIDSHYCSVPVLANGLFCLQALNYHPFVGLIDRYEDVTLSTNLNVRDYESCLPLQNWDKAIVYSQTNLYLLHDMCFRSMMYLNPPTGFSYNGKVKK